MFHIPYSSFYILHSIFNIPSPSKLICIDMWSSFQHLMLKVIIIFNIFRFMSFLIFDSIYCFVENRVLLTTYKTPIYCIQVSLFLVLSKTKIARNKCLSIIKKGISKCDTWWSRGGCVGQLSSHAVSIVVVSLACNVDTTHLSNRNTRFFKNQTLR